VPPEPRLVHGDFRNRNIIVGPMAWAVLDWELAISAIRSKTSAGFALRLGGSAVSSGRRVRQL